MVLTRSQILDSRDLQFAEVDVPAWGGLVRVRALNAGEMAQFRAMSVEVVDQQTREIRDGHRLFTMSAWVVCRGVVDDQGQRVFADSDLDLLTNKSAVIIDEIAERILSISDAAATVEDEKNG